MDGIHDLGGMAGFGAIAHEPDEPVWHEPWEADAFSLMMATQMVVADMNADEYRHSVERMDPIHYLRARYYERMFTGTTTMLVERGILDPDDLARRAGGAFPLARPVADDPVEPQTPHTDPRFAVGDVVRVREMHPRGHVRAPRFCRGRIGTVLHVAPRFKFPDTSAHHREGRTEHTYHVEFTATELWGDDETNTDTVVVDLWDSYLEATP